MEERLQQGIDVRQVDLTDASFEPVFDAVVANMVFLSIPNWEAAMETCVRALRPGGRLVFSVEHPCFETASNRGEGPATLMVTDYHRTLSTYLNAVVRAGCQISEIDEPGLPAELVSDASQRSLVHFPCFLVVSAQKVARVLAFSSHES